MSAAKRDAWICQPCRSNTGDPSNPDEPSCTQLSSVIAKLDQLTATVASMAEKMEVMLAFKETSEKLVQSVSFLSEKYDNVLETATTNKAELTQLKAEVASLSLTVAQQNDTIDKMSTEINDLEQYTRRANFEIHGFPATRGEDLVAFVTDLAIKLNIADFQKTDIATVHRLPARQDAIPSIIVQMKTAAKKQVWMNARKGLAALQSDTFPRLYFNENLTRTNRELFRLARFRGKEKGFKFIWTGNGKVLAKKCEGAPVTRIEKLSDLEKIV